MPYKYFLRRNIILPLLIFSLAGLVSCDFLANLFAKEKDYTKETLNILFIGNSFTQYNDGVDRELGRLFTSSLPRKMIYVDRHAVGGERLSGHYKKKIALDLIESNSWDIVVIQEYSNYPISNKPEFFKYSALFRDKINDCGAETVLFMTWAYKDNDDMTSIIANSYINLGNELGCRVANVGLAFQSMAKLHPEINLYSDYKHPNNAGTYLAACCFYVFLTDESPLGIPYIAGLEPNVAAAIQKTAWDIIGSRLHSK